MARRTAGRPTANGPADAPAGPKRDAGQVIVLGMGRFGSALAIELGRLGFEVLAVDGNPRNVQTYAQQVTHIVEADATDVEALRQLGAADAGHAVVAIGSDIEASILATAALDDLRVPSIWAKAVTKAHGKILERVGAHHVVYPEHDMGHRVAHLLGDRVLDWLQLDETFALAETVVPSAVAGLSLLEAGVRAKYEVTVVCVKPAGGAFTYATPDTIMERGDVLVVAGPTEAAEAFARLA